MSWWPWTSVSRLEDAQEEIIRLREKVEQLEHDRRHLINQMVYRYSNVPLYPELMPKPTAVASTDRKADADPLKRDIPGTPEAIARKTGTRNARDIVNAVQLVIDRRHAAAIGAVKSGATPPVLQAKVVDEVATILAGGVPANGNGAH
jgi:hypothetical protein